MWSKIALLGGAILAGFIIAEIVWRVWLRDLREEEREGWRK